MSLVDWIIVGILAVSVLAGIAQGFLRSAFSLGGLILGLVLAAWNYEKIAVFAKKLVVNEEVANAVGFLVIAVLVMIVAGVTGNMLSRLFQKIGLGCLDSMAGAVFGFFQGMLFVTVCILVTVAFFPETEWLTQSRLPRYFFGACHLSTNISPEGLARLVREDLHRLESESPRWMHPENRK
jgi:membrane protein required for colicin V production